MDFEKDFARLTDKLKNAKSVEIPFGPIEEIEESFILGLVTKGLTYIDQHALIHTVQMVVEELIQNAEKALLKRVHAEEKGLASAAEDDAAAVAFGARFQTEGKVLRGLLRKYKRKCQFSISIQDGDLTCAVINPGHPNEREAGFIRRAFATIQQDLDLLEGVQETGESQGLGLLLAGMALRRAGLGEALTWTVADDHTRFQLAIPGKHAAPEMDRANRFIQEIDELPAFPANLQAILNICNSDKSDARQVAREIEKDPVIASRLIKLANSGGFAGGKIADLLEAVKIVGISNIAGILLNVGAHSILEERYEISEELREHPMRVAFYSRHLARKNRLAALADQAYVAGLLHDLGHIVLLAGMKKTKRVESLLRRNHLRTLLNIEELLCGISHATLGALLGAKWNFPPSLLAAMGLHHSPHRAEKGDRELVYLVYLANAIADAQAGKTNFYALEPEVMEFFNITTEQAFTLIAASLDAEYRKGP